MATSSGADMPSADSKIGVKGKLDRKSKVKQKIDFDMMKGDQLQQEKAQVMETRFQVRRQADRQKRELVEQVERLKKKGKIGREDLLTLGLIEDDQMALTDTFVSPTSSMALEKAHEDKI